MVTCAATAEARFQKLARGCPATRGNGEMPLPPKRGFRS